MKSHKKIHIKPNIVVICGRKRMVVGCRNKRE